MPGLHASKTPVLPSTTWAWLAEDIRFTPTEEFCLNGPEFNGHGEFEAENIEQFISSTMYLPDV